jgi:dienelactone hydrolase
MFTLIQRYFGPLLLLLSFAVAAGNHDKVMPPISSGSYPVACSNIAHDEAAMNRIGGLPADFWEGTPQNGQLRYITQILAEPQTAIQFSLHIPDDRGLYTNFADGNLQFVTLVCYPTSPANSRPDYLLPDGQVIPRMERPGDLPIFPDSSTAYPLIVYSHGIGGSPVSNDYLGTILRLARHGYAVMAVFHGDARIARIRIGDLSGVIHLISNFDQYVELQAMRPLALKAALDDLLARPGYSEHIDQQQIGGFGASLGGEALLLSMGAQLTNNTRLDSRAVAQDERIKAAVGYVPYAGQRLLPAFGNDQNGAQYVTRPFLAIGGTADTTAPLYMTEQAVNRFGGSRYLVALTDVEHQYLPEYADDVFSWAITFFDAHVRDDREALSRLVQTAAIEGGLIDSLRIDYTAPTALSTGEDLVTEHFYQPLGHFFAAANDAERAFADTGAEQGWSRTGQAFKALLAPQSAHGVNTRPVCRYFGVEPIKPTFFYSSSQAECDFLRANNPGWRDIGTAFYSWSPDIFGNCADGLIGVYRLYNNGWQPPRYDPNHRYTTSLSTVAEMVRNGWVNEGQKFCAPL